jgi:hypothetical protein
MAKFQYLGGGKYKNLDTGEELDSTQINELKATAASKGVTPKVTAPESGYTPPAQEASKTIPEKIFGALSKPTPKVSPIFKAKQDAALGNFPTEGVKLGVNLLPSALNFGTGIVDFLNPVANVKKIGEGVKAMDQVAGSREEALRTGNPTLGDVAKELPSAAWQTLMPEFVQKLFSGDIEGARQKLIEDPVGQLAPLYGGYKLGESALAKVTPKPVPPAGTPPSGTPPSGVVPTVTAAVKPKVTAPITESMKQAAQQASQGRVGQIPSFVEGVADMPNLKNVKTFEQFKQAATDHVAELAKKQDAELAKDTKVYTPDELKITVKTPESGIGVPDFPVKRAAEQLSKFALETHNEALFATVFDKFLKKLSDPEYRTEVQPDGVVQLRIETRPGGVGLTLSEVNELARLYGETFSQKAFSKTTGEPLHGITAEAFENTRKGIKEAFRQHLPDEASKILDERMSNAFTVKELSNKMAEKVNQLEAKIQRKGFGQKAAGLIAGALNIATLGVGKALLRNVLSEVTQAMGGKDVTMNAIELEKALQGNLRIIQNALDDTSPAFLDNFVNALKTANTVVGKPVMNPTVTKMLPIILNPSGKEEK